MRAHIVLAVAVGALAWFAGCASRCDYAQTKCQYQCKRNYQMCELHNIDELYCHNQIGNCWLSCDADHVSCKNSWW